MKDALTIHEAAETTGWSPRMLRYVERIGLVEPARSDAGLPPLRPGGAPAAAHPARAARPLRRRPRRGRLRAAPARRRGAARRGRGVVRGRARSVPSDVPAADWLRWEQEKHQRLLAAAAAAEPATRSRGDPRMTHHRRPPPSTDFKVADLSPRRVRPQGDPPRRARDARPDVDPRGVRRRRSR